MTKKRGFAAMTKDQRYAAQSLGGRRRAERRKLGGTAYTFEDREYARQCGLRGGRPRLAEKSAER